MFTWAKIALALLSIIGWIRDQKLISTAEDAQLAQELAKVLADVEAANKARDDVANKLHDDPNWVPTDDPNLRK